MLKNLTMARKQRRIGVWLIGARGGLATTLIAGTRLLAHGLVPPTGLLTEGPSGRGARWAPFDSFVFGGHDIRGGTLKASAAAVAAATHCFPADSLAAIRKDLDAVDRRILHGAALNCGPAIRRLAERKSSRQLAPHALLRQFRQDLRSFRESEALDELVVVNVASTEPPLKGAPHHRQMDMLLRAIRKNSNRLRSSEIYGAAAALEADVVLNFTPNEAFLTPAVREIALLRGVLYMGNDGKTGETLVKSALAPMFRYRNLQVLSWMGYNLLGDRDGEVLRDPAHKAAKVRNKDGILGRILGYTPDSLVRIDYVPSLEDNKTAWDFVHFAGFLGHRMSLQFTWAGTDSVLAAPLILDMIRMAVVAKERGESGAMPQLGVFFKAPLDVAEDDLHSQFHRLEAWLAVGRTH